MAVLFADATTVASDLVPGTDVNYIHKFSIAGDATYPAGGTLSFTNAAAGAITGFSNFVKELLRATPLGAMADKVELLAVIDCTAPGVGQRVAWNEATDALQVRNYADGTDATPGDLSANTYSFVIIAR